MVNGIPVYHMFLTDRLFPDSMHADTNQFHGNLEMLNALSSSIDYFNGNQFSAVGTFTEQQESVQRAFWSAFRDIRVRSQLGHVGKLYF
jgi:hypothetical protein